MGTMRIYELSLYFAGKLALMPPIHAGYFETSADARAEMESFYLSNPGLVGVVFYRVDAIRYELGARPAAFLAAKQNAERD